MGTADALASLFEDGGKAILEEGGLGSTWSEALAHVPAAVLDAAGPEAGLRALVQLRDFWSQQRDLQPAIAATRGLLRWCATHRGPDHPDTWVEASTFGALAMRAGRLAEGGQLVERAWNAVSGRLAEEDPRLAAVAAHVGRQFAETNRLAEAERALSLSLRIRRARLPETAGVIAAQLAEVYLAHGRAELAIPLLNEAVAQYRSQLGPDHPSTIARIRTSAAALQTAGRWRDAIPLWREAWKWLADAGDVEARAAVAFELGIALEQVEQRDEAFRMLEESVRWTRQAGDPHPQLAARLSAFANAELRRGRAGVAEGLLQEALEVERRLSGDGSERVAERYASLGGLLATPGRIDEALGWLDTGASLLRARAGDADPRTRGVVETLVGLLLARAVIALEARDRDYAAVALDRAWELAPPVLGHVHEKTRKIRDLRERHRLA
jgi:tetratricopeptide (TPR) repeat protein